MTRNKNIEIENADYGLDSRYQSDKEKKSEAVALMQSRLNRMRNFTKEQVLHAKLMQLKFKMENFLKHPVFDKRNYFTEFLETYIDINYLKRSDFAEDIDVTPVLLSQIINNHRAPKDEFILKLMLHSEMVFKKVGEFRKEIWYQVYFHEKICDTMSTQKEWRPKLEKRIRYQEPGRKIKRLQKVSQP